MLQINKYEKGIAYYTVLIKHFGDDLTPWGSTVGDPAPTIGSGIAEAYPVTNRDANYLGRYGVLRNNWYDINVTGVSGLGDASDPSDRLSKDPTPDDNLDAYIACKINILSWAKRTQSVELK